MGERFPGITERIDTSPPQWWGALAGPVLVALGSTLGRRRVTLAGTALAAVATAAVRDIASSPTVPGANDNLSAVAVGVALAEALRERPVSGLRVVIASMGAEEVLQGGIYGSPPTTSPTWTASAPGCSTRTRSAPRRS